MTASLALREMALSRSWTPIVLSIACALAPYVHAQDADADFALLRDASIFKIGLVGIAGQVSDEELALRRIVQSPDARDRLSRLAQEGATDESKLYALCGLSVVSRPLFAQKVDAIQWSGPSFNEMKADVIHKSSVRVQLERWKRGPCRFERM